MKKPTEQEVIDQLYQCFCQKIDTHRKSNTPISPSQFLKEARKLKSSQYQYKTTLNKNIVFTFEILHRLYCIWLKMQNNLLKRAITEQQALFLEAVRLAPYYGAIIIDSKNREWVDQVIQEKNVTDQDIAFTLVWTQCISHRKKTMGENGQNTWRDMFLFIMMLIGFILLSASLLVTIVHPVLFIVAGCCVYYFGKITLLMNKALAFDGNKLVKQIIAASV